MMGLETATFFPLRSNERNANFGQNFLLKKMNLLLKWQKWKNGQKVAVVSKAPDENPLL